MEGLISLSKTKRSGVRSVVNNGIMSLICQDNLYKTGKLPIMARGLFINAENKIVIRGYDKFFNIGEVPTTEWDYLKNHTTGPYYIVLKENGCMIFISSDGNGDLNVTSKHSFISPHAEKAKYWLNIHLNRVNKTRNELSLKLVELNSTISLELCSDDFEEHVLHYDECDWGLYCHGLIKNIEIFETYEPGFVQEFSREYGFNEVPFVKRNSIEEVKSFCEAKEGKPIEGWVIRSGNMFVKYKYERPYLMWREWREITRAYLKNGVLHEYNWKYPESGQYSEWVKKEIITNIHVFDGFLQNHGIIKIRDMFLNANDNLQEKQEPFQDMEKILIISTMINGKFSNKE